MSDFTIAPYTVSPFKSAPFTTNPWTGISAFEFTNTGATISPVITVTGTPEILWTWSDGTTDNVANPGVKTVTGTHTLLVTPWSAVTIFNFELQFVSDIVLQEWEGLEELLFNNNSFYSTVTTYEWSELTDLRLDNCHISGVFTTWEWENLDRIFIHGNTISGSFVFRNWDNLVHIRINENNITSFEGSLQTQVKATLFYLHNNNVSSQTNIDKVLSDLLVNAAAALRWGSAATVALSGANMSAPSAAGIADAATLVATYGWTVTHE